MPTPYHPRWYRYWPPLRHCSLSASSSMPSCCWWGLFRRSGSANGRLGLACHGLGWIRALPPLAPSSQRSARWSSLQARRILLGVLLEALVGEGPLIVGIEEILERRYRARRSRPGASTEILSVLPKRPS
jgi:hypothetical protein